MNTEKPVTTLTKKTSTFLLEKFPWFLVGFLLATLIALLQPDDKKQQRIVELESQLDTVTSDVQALQNLHRENKSMLASELASIQQNTAKLETQTQGLLKETKLQIASNATEMRDNQRLFSLKSFIDDLTGAHLRVYYHNGQKIDKLEQYLAFVQDQIVQYTLGADSKFIEKNKYYYYDLMAALIIYGSKSADYKKKWNDLQLNESNPVFTTILKAFKEELPEAESKTMMASLKQIHENATSGDELPFVTAN